MLEWGGVLVLARSMHADAGRRALEMRPTETAYTYYSPGRTFDPDK